MSATTPHTLRLSVDNIGFLLDKLGEDCAPLQFLRELTQNSIEAILKLPDQTGEIVWDADWETYEQSGIYKLSVTDSGCGMSGEEMVKYITNFLRRHNSKRLTATTESVRRSRLRPGTMLA